VNEIDRLARGARPLEKRTTLARAADSHLRVSDREASSPVDDSPRLLLGSSSARWQRKRHDHGWCHGSVEIFVDGHTKVRLEASTPWRLVRSSAEHPNNDEWFSRIMNCCPGRGNFTQAVPRTPRHVTDGGILSMTDHDGGKDTRYIMTVGAKRRRPRLVKICLTRFIHSARRRTGLVAFRVEERL
jgi:hypothetical protein